VTNLFRLAQQLVQAKIEAIENTELNQQLTRDSELIYFLTPRFYPLVREAQKFFDFHFARNIDFGSTACTESESGSKCDPKRLQVVVNKQLSP
jgi:hypothetical protein